MIAKIRKVLADGAWKPIKEIADKTGHSASTASKYLGIMRERGEVELKKEATMKKFRLKKAGNQKENE